MACRPQAATGCTPCVPPAGAPHDPPPQTGGSALPPRPSYSSRAAWGPDRAGTAGRSAHEAAQCTPVQSASVHAPGATALLSRAAIRVQVEERFGPAALLHRKEAHLQARGQVSWNRSKTPQTVAWDNLLLWPGWRDAAQHWMVPTKLLTSSCHTGTWPSAGSTSTSNRRLASANKPCSSATCAVSAQTAAWDFCPPHRKAGRIDRHNVSHEIASQN